MAQATQKQIGGKPYLAFTVAHNGKVDGQPEAVYIDCLMYDRGTLVEWLKKGTRVLVSGDFRDWKTIGASGQTFINRSIFVKDLQLISQPRGEEDDLPI